MGRFAARPLQTLEAIYRFIGDVGPFNVDTKSPIQLVHGVEREAELGASFIANLSFQQATAGDFVRTFSGIDGPLLFSAAGTVNSALRALGRTLENTDSYLLSIWPVVLQATQADFVDAIAYCQSPNDLRFSRQDAQDFALVSFANASVGAAVTATSTFTGCQFVDPITAAQSSTDSQRAAQLPMRFENIFTSMSDDGTGPATVRWNIICAFVPAYSEPPRG